MKQNKNRQTSILSFMVSFGMIALLAVFLGTERPVQAIVTMPTMTIISDSNGDGVAGVADGIEFRCRSDNATAGITPFVNLSSLGYGTVALAPMGGGYYNYVITSVKSGNYDSSSFNTLFTDNDSAVSAGSMIAIDNQAPRSLLGVNLDSTQPHGAAGEYIAGDRLVFDIDFTDADGQNGPPRLSVYANLTNLGLGTNVPLNHSGAGKYTFDRVLPLGRERIGDTFDLLAIDDAGNRTTFAKAISYDTKAPKFKSVSAVNTTTGSTYVKTGDTIKITVVLSEYDNETVTCSHTALISGSPVTMNKTTGGTTGTDTTFEYTFQVPVGTNIESNFVTFDIEAVDDAGNRSTRITNALPTDTIPPIFQPPVGIAIIERGGIRNDNIAVIGDQLYIMGNLSTIPTSDIQVTVDLSGVGGVSNQLLPFTPGSTTFSLTYDIHPGTSEDYTPRSFRLKAVDKATNAVYEVTLPVIYVDSQAPSFGSVQLQNVSAATTAKLGHVIGIQANLTNLDGGSIWTDFRQIGGNGSDTLTLSGASAYRLEMPVGLPAPGYWPVDTLKSYTVWATDNAGNLVSMQSNGLYFDNEPPQIIAATYTVTPALSTTHPWIKTGDTVKFLVQLASSSSGIYDGQTVALNLSNLGASSNQAMNFDGAGTYTYSIVVPSGALNSDTTFPVTAKDNADNTVTTAVELHIDNMAPTPGPLTVNYLRDVAKTGAVNFGDRMEFIIPCADPDGGSCTLDLSLVGSSSASLVPYDQVLQRYYLVYDTATATIENPGYVFRAMVSDKAGNTFNSLSSSFEVDCVPPTLYYASATFQNLLGSSTVVNIGDRVTITALTEVSRLDGGTPKVNLTALGGNAAQVLFDDGAHEDGASGDGLYGFTFVVGQGSLDGQRAALVVDLTDNAGNKAVATTESLFVDNMPLTIASFNASQSFDNNGNTIVDLDGYYTTMPIVATDVVKMTVKILGNSWDFGQVTVDLSPLGINNPNYPLAFSGISGGWTAVASFSPLAGTTNRQYNEFTVTAVDVNGNVVYATSTPRLLIDNQPPTIQMYPISFITDNGRLNEANEGDVIRIKVRMTNHDGILPQIDFTNLYIENGLTPPSPTLFPPTGGPNEYYYDWTIPAGLGTSAPLTVIGYDSSGNMVVGYTNIIRFLSKVPSIRGFPSSRADLSLDSSFMGEANRIANPGDQVSLTCVLSSVYNASNTPPAVVLADIRSITSDVNDDSSTTYYDGDYSTYWVPLQYQPFPVSGAGNYLYKSVFTVGAGKRELLVASFPVKVLHPDVLSITMASSTLICDPANPFGIDTQVPNIVRPSIAITSTNGDNVSPSIANIGDIISVAADILDYPDSGSATVRILSSGSALIESAQMVRFDGDHWEASFIVATNTVVPWNITLQGVNNNDFLRYEIRATDDGGNAAVPVSQISTFTVDNTPTVLFGSQFVLSPNAPFNWVANVGSGTASDSLIASITVDFKPYDAFVDLSVIQGSSSWPIKFTGALLNGKSSPFVLATGGIDLATFTFPITVRDSAGNITATETILAVDTTRPRLIRSEYDGQRLKLTFSEALSLYPSTPINFDQTKVRIGWRTDLTGNPPDASFTVQLGAYDYVEETGGDTDQVTILLDQITRNRIAEWGNTSLWLSMGTSNFNGEGASVARDLSGNWMTPLRQSPATHTINIPDPYAVKPNLVRGWYDAVNFPNELHVVFDKDMASSTITDSTITALSIVKNRTPDSLPADYTKRYTMILGTDSLVIPNPNTREFVIRLSPPAQDWIATKFSRTGSNLYFSVSTYPILIRDLQGNRVNTLGVDYPVAASLTPVVSNFNINNNASLDVVSGIMTMTFDRRARLFYDEYQVGMPFPSGKTVTNVSTGRILLYKNANRSGSSITLARSSVPAATGSILLNDYASTTVRIQLSADDIRDILSWNSSRIYVACEQAAFKDLWDNSSNQFPIGGGDALAVNVSFPTVYSGPRVVAVAMSDPPPTKLWQSGQLFYEVEFETATIPPNITVPVNRDAIPTLVLTRQDDNSTIDIGSFSAWFEREVGGVKRTIARFANTQPFPVMQRVPAMLTIDNCYDVFGKPVNPQPTTASMVYDLSARTTSGTGYGSLYQPLVIDSQAPQAITVTPVGTIGITQPNSSIFLVTFDEPMDQSEAYRPTLRLGDAVNTVMNFGFDSWINSTTARFYNASPFDSTTAQGSATYYVTGGYDLAGNRGPDNGAYAGGQLEIRSRGPVLNSYTVTTYQATTAKLSMPSGNITGKPFSPYVPSGIATITISFTNTPQGPYTLHFFQGNTSLASLPITLSGNTGTARWDGTLNGTAIGQTGPTTYELRVLDIFGNEGSIVGSVVYDGQSPTVLSWNITRARVTGTKTYFSPKVHNYMKIDALGVAAGEAIYLRCISSIATNTYAMAPLSGGGYTVNFEGKSTDAGTPVLVDGQYTLNLVDAAGNIGRPLAPTSVATISLIIDNTDPAISSLITMRTDNGSQTTRFNPRVTTLTIQAGSGDPAISSGTILARITAGSTVIRDLPLTGAVAPLTAVWDGLDSNGQMVTDGTYRVSVIDLAENPSSLFVDVDVRSAAFKVTSASELDAQTVRVVFSQDVNVDDASNVSNYTLNPNTPTGIAVIGPVVINGKIVDLPLNTTMAHASSYTVTVTAGVRSIDDDPLTSGNNTAVFSADTQGPLMTNVTYDGVTSQREFNVVFDETITPTTATQVGNWQFLAGNDPLALSSVTVRSDNRSAKVTAAVDLVDATNYTIIASGVEDAFRNRSNGALSRFAFKGRDVTAPVLTTSVFSNPSNEFDISVTVKSNEDLQAPPTAIVTQSGGTAVSLVLNAGPTTRLWLAGAHLDRSYPGVVTVSVTAKDNAGNSGTSNTSFSTAFVNASVRAELLSADGRFTALIPTGALNQPSMVTIVNQPLSGVQAVAGARRAAIRPSALTGLDAATLASLKLGVGDGTAGEELAPVGSGYAVNIPANRLSAPIEVSLRIAEEQLPAGLGLFHLEADGSWKYVSRNVSEKRVRHITLDTGTFALLRDKDGPRLQLVTKLPAEEPLREDRPTFEWTVTENGSGIDASEMKVLLDGVETDGMIDPAGTKVTFRPLVPMVAGEHRISLRISDRTGNVTVSPEIRFQVQPPLAIHEIVQFPNPARNRVNLRISTNRALQGELVEAEIFAVNGHRVRGREDLTMTTRLVGGRQVQDLAWDLTDESGAVVANGVYFARISVHDPDTGKRTKVTHKIAVLR